MPGTGFSLYRLLRLAWIRWRYSNPLPCREQTATQSQSQSHIATDGRSNFVNLRVINVSPLKISLYGDLVNSLLQLLPIPADNTLTRTA
jgi:hypothetical protein